MYYGVKELSKASQHRWDDARALYAAKRWRGAMYLAGYVIECLLKTKLMSKHACRTLAELEDRLRDRGLLAKGDALATHRLEFLLGLTQRADVFRQDRALWRRFNNVNRWVPDWRYASNHSNVNDAEGFLEAVGMIRSWIESNV